jgi:hypothetical protein
LGHSGALAGVSSISGYIFSLEVTHVVSVMGQYSGEGRCGWNPDGSQRNYNQLVEQFLASSHIDHRVWSVAYGSGGRK